MYRRQEQKNKNSCYYYNKINKTNRNFIKNQVGGAASHSLTSRSLTPYWSLISCNTAQIWTALFYNTRCNAKYALKCEVMMNKDDIILKKSILHILDSTLGMPVLSDVLLDIGTELSDFICTHIARLLSGDDLKTCYFQENTSIVHQLVRQFDEADFIPFSQQLGSRLYQIMNENPAIPPADFLVSLFQYGENRYLALLKLNYRDTYVHFTGNNDAADGENTGKGCINRIMKQKATLPSSGSRLSEAVMIDLSDFHISLVEKKYEINGTKENYLSTLFLECGTRLSQKAKMNLITRAVEQINEKFFDQDLEKKMETKSVFQKEIEDEGVLQIQKTADILYSHTPEVKEAFLEKMEKYHIEQEEIRPQNPSTTKKFTKQYLTTDNGIEINIPTEYYGNTENVEFITNPDGTISILIKNINHIQAK